MNGRFTGFRGRRAIPVIVCVALSLWACRAEEKRPEPTDNVCSRRCSLAETRSLAGFEDGTDDFSAGKNVDSLERAASVPGWTDRVYEGRRCLQVRCPDVPGRHWRTVFREYDRSVDLSGTPVLSFGIHTDEGAPAADYYVRLVLCNGAGSTFESMARVMPKEWNATIFDLHECPFLDNIRRMEIGLMNDSDSIWRNAAFRIDGIEAGRPIDLTFEMPGSASLFEAERGEVSQQDGMLVFDFETGGTLTSPSLAGSRNSVFNPELRDRNTMFFVMENRSSAQKLKIGFLTDKEGEYAEVRSKTFDIEPSSPKRAYYFNFSDLETAAGHLTGFRIEPLGGEGMLLIDRITFEREAVLEPFAGTIDACTADDDKITIRGTVRPEYGERYSRIAVYEAPMYVEEKGTAGLTRLYEGPLSSSFAIDCIPLRRRNGNTHLSSRLLAVAEDDKGGSLKIAPYFYIENWRDFTDNPYAFRLPERSVSVLDFGARGDGFTDDTRSIQAAVDEVSARGGGRVVLPGDSGLYGRRYVATHIMMRSNVELHLAKGAILWQSQEENDYPYRPVYGHDVIIPNTPWTHSLYVNRPLIQAKDVENIKITGPGKIRSADPYCVDPHLDHYARTCTDRIHVVPIGCWKVTNMELSDLELVRTNNYHTGFYFCRNLFVGNVKMHEVQCVSGDGVSLSIGTNHVKVARLIFESNDDGIVLCSSYNDPRGGVWWWGDNDWDRSVRHVEVCHSYINSGGGKAIALIPWGSNNPDQQKQETDSIFVYDNVLRGGYSVGTWPDNPFDGKPFDNTEVDDYAPVKNFRIFDNEYLSPCDLLCIRPTNFITDCGIRSSSTFRNGDFAFGHTYWTMEGEAGEENGYGYARHGGRLYEGLYLPAGDYDFAAETMASGEMFVENAESGEPAGTAAIETETWAPQTLRVRIPESGTYFLGIRGADARIRNAVLTKVQ